MYYNKILGGIVGDIIGSTRERKNVKNENFELLPAGSTFTDDTVMTLAVAEWLMTDPTHSEHTLVECMQRLGRKYPNAGYGEMFRRWLSTDNPEPYNSFGNGSAMRVSPVGLYANSMEEALELARITASVSHNHPEGIKGAQAIAASIYIKRTEMFDVKGNIKRFVEQNFGYNLDVNIRDIRDDYSFDVTCQGSVPIAIMAFLQEPHNAEKAIRLAVSMGGDSDTIGCMTASIAATERPYVISSSSLSHEIEDKCRALLPADLLDINDRFLDFISRPLHQSYEVRANGIIYAGEYPGDKSDELARQKIEQMHHFGIRHFIDLTEEGELRPYSHLLPAGTTYTRFPIADCGAPKSIESVQSLLLRIEELKKMNGYVYVHCWGGVGRTGTIVACYLSQNWGEPDLNLVLDALRKNFSEMPKSAYKKTPETKEQIDFIKQFINTTTGYKEEKAKRVTDSIRGCLMAGATGDALGYEVEFMSRRAILSRFGEQGITKFTLDNKGKALISDDTQMTLFTANGMLMGLTRGYMRGIGGRPEEYVDGAYLDWYYTQTGKKKEILINDFHYTWLRDLPEMAQCRAPGNTCLQACESMFRREHVHNNSKGCGGIMRVAPMALLDAGYASRDKNTYSLVELAEAGGKIAECTHKHPLAFLPASLLTILLYKVVPMAVKQVQEDIDRIINETLDMLDFIYIDKYESEKQYLRDLSEKAIRLAHSDISDADAIRELGEGWVAEETWAIALYSAVRHIDSVEDAIIASVNHDGDSDSTGSVCGNIMGAIYGYEHIKERNIFCPEGKLLEDTLELSEIILALANDLSTGCIISECNPIDTPEKQQWYERYCEMKPAGIRNN
ncbi:MAG: ADP-ribosylglycohydrolase family protein [Bacteroidaceae bacterium]|nr:ADP-ribosylglycohydrolase family protein [Bacteroidaceae bacterium]